MPAKLKSFILPALLFALVSAINAQTQSSADSAVKKSQGVAAVKKKWFLSALEGKWYLQTGPDSDTASVHVPEIQFDTEQGLLSGSTGCNRMSGSFIATDSTLHISDRMITTRMYCQGYDESAFLQNLLKVESYYFKKGFLILTAKGEVVSRWSRKIN